MAGSRSGGIIAATWAAMVSTGQNGYMERAAALVEVTNTLIKGETTKSNPEYAIVCINIM